MEKEHRRMRLRQTLQILERVRSLDILLDMFQSLLAYLVARMR